jgi:SNF2 family DNA or RNA helicase
MQVPQSKVSLGISVSDGLLQLDLDTGEFPAAELEDLYQSLLLRRKYHRLRDGRYLTLDGSAYETMAELAHIAQLTPQELADGKATMPAFRALYLDSVVGGNENIEVRRNNQFRAMVRQFKTVGDNDYEIPAAQRAVLRPYQKLGFRWLKTLESCHFGGILADDMGLGKTLQMITYFASVYLDQTLPSLIVCPASLVFNWADEFARFAPDLPVRLITGTAAERREALAQPLAGTILVTSYDLLKRDVELYRPVEFYCCILDEGQFIKNQSTQASKAVKQINCRQRYVLTGTPIENRLSELWNLFDFLMPGYLFTHNRFVEKLEKPIAKKGDEVARQQLAKLVKPFILRRLKGDVLKELPPKMERDWRIQLSEEERKVYLAAVHAIRHGEVGGKLEILTALTRLRQICCDPGLCYENYEGPTSKLDACVDLCSTLAENGHQILLFSQFTSMLDRLRERLETAHITTFTLQGSTPKEKRAQLVKQFNSGGAQVFLISLKAGGTGLNLTAADVVIHYDPWWNRAVQDQATDRAHRIGQQASVQVYKLIAKDTIEEKIQELQQRKTALMDVLDQDGSADLASLSREELLELLEI